jgi:hypothetical protein
MYTKSVHNGKPVKRNDAEGLERVAQYIIRNPFSEQKMAYNEENGAVIYRSRTRPAVAMGRPAFAEKLRPGKLSAMLVAP